MNVSRCSNWCEFDSLHFAWCIGPRAMPGSRSFRWFSSIEPEGGGEKKRSAHNNNLWLPGPKLWIFFVIIDHSMTSSSRTNLHARTQCYNYLNSGSGEIWNFKSDVNRRFSFGVFPFDGWKTKMSAHEKLLASRKRFYRPDDRILKWIQSIDVEIQNIR